MHDGWFKLASGRTVSLQQFHIRVSEQGFLLGSAERIRAEVLSSLRGEYGLSNALVLREPPPGRLPAYTFIAEFSGERLSPGADCSGLFVCWFGTSLPESIRAFVGSQLEMLDWEKHARDHSY
jgi:hypothetical protein